MKIVRNGQIQNISDRIKSYKKLLKKNQKYTISTPDHLDHIAAYIAWKEVGGNLLIKSSLLPLNQQVHFEKVAETLELENSLVFHTSGTTGYPKLIPFSMQQMDDVEKLSAHHLQWNKETNWLNLIPAQTSGFWHIVIPSLVERDSSIVLGSRETMQQDFSEPTNTTIFVPGLIDQFRCRNISLPLSRFHIIGVGASQMLERHATYLFKNGCKKLNHMYGATETGSPVIGHISKELDDMTLYLEMTDNCKIIDDELVYNGIRTGDLFERKSNFIKFKGRSNEIVKINGYQCNLLFIESLLEDMEIFGEILAVPRNKSGVDYIEIFHTEGAPDKIRIKHQLQDFLPRCNIPSSYTKIESIPKNALSKKVRGAICESKSG